MKKRILALVLVVLFVVGCGGGSSSSDPVVPQSDPISEIIYSGINEFIEVNEDNVLQITTEAVNGGPIGTKPPVNYASDFSNTIILTNSIKEVSKEIKINRGNNSSTTLYTEQQILIGNCGGRTTVNINSDNLDFAWGDVKFENYCMDEVFLNGDAEFDAFLDDFTYNIRSINFFFDYIEAYYDESTYAFKGTISQHLAHLYEPLGHHADRYEIYTKYFDLDKVYYFKGYLRYSDYCPSYAAVDFMSSGEYCNPDMGCVSISGSFHYECSDRIWPSGGTVNVHGMNNTKASLRPLSEQYFYIYIQDYNSGPLLWGDYF